MNYAAWLKARLDDPRTSTADYRRYWNEWQYLEYQQKCATEQARRQWAEQQQGA